MFKRKKKKTGIQTPEFRKPTPPPKPPKPPTSGSNAFKPSPVAVLPNDISTVAIMCQYETPCGWCCKWDKKCDKKIGPERGQRVNINPIDDAMDEPIGIVVNTICKSESDHEWECVGISTGGSTYRCRKCYTHKTIPIKTEILETYIGGC